MSRAATIGSIVIVEPWAHLPNGHFPNRFAELADAFAELGVPVAVLTSVGWHRDFERAAGWTVHRYSRGAAITVALAERWSTRLQRHWSRARPFTRLVASATAVVQARRLARRLERSVPNGVTGIVTLDYVCAPLLLDLIGGSRPWVQHVFDEGVPFSTLLPLAELLARVRRLRGRSRSRVAMALANDGWIAPMAKHAPNPHPALLRLAGTRQTATTKEAPRQRLGLREDLPVALHFGSTSADRRPLTVARAFAARSDWQLLLVGEMADVLGDRSLTGTAWSVPPVAIGGIASDETRTLAYAAADVVILSFREGFDRNSGTLMDAVSFGKPVVVSGPSYPADVVAQLGIGTVYDNGDPEGLSEALDALTAVDTSQALADACERLSNRAIACAHLELLAALANDDEKALGSWVDAIRP